MSRNYFNRYQHDGLAALLEDDYAGAKSRLSEQKTKNFETYPEGDLLPELKMLLTKNYHI